MIVLLSLAMEINTILGSVGSRIITDIKDFEVAKRKWYDRLASFMISLVDFSGIRAILEVGCGQGDLTIPFIKKLGANYEKVIAFDSSVGPYAGDLEVLTERIKAEGLEANIEVKQGDCRNMKAINDESFDLIVSNELFCDLDKVGLEKALKELYRVLKTGGQMIHGELIPVATNKAQELLIEADLNYSLESTTPKGDGWFSPTVDYVAAIMHKTGFWNIHAHYLKTDLILSYDVAAKQLRHWQIDTRFIDENYRDLQRFGIEFPMEHIIVCEKFMNQDKFK